MLGSLWKNWTRVLTKKHLGFVSRPFLYLFHVLRSWDESSVCEVYLPFLDVARSFARFLPVPYRSRNLFWEYSPVAFLEQPKRTVDQRSNTRGSNHQNLDYRATAHHVTASHLVGFVFEETQASVRTNNSATMNKCEILLLCCTNRFLDLSDVFISKQVICELLGSGQTQRIMVSKIDHYQPILCLEGESVAREWCVSDAESDGWNQEPLRRVAIPFQFVQILDRDGQIIVQTKARKTRWGRGQQYQHVPCPMRSFTLKVASYPFWALDFKELGVSTVPLQTGISTDHRRYFEILQETVPFVLSP